MVHCHIRTALLGMPGVGESRQERVRPRGSAYQLGRLILVACESVCARYAQSYFEETLPVLPRRLRLSLQQPAHGQAALRGFTRYDTARKNSAGRERPFFDMK